MAISLEYNKQRILTVLSENLKNPQPDVMPSASIADTLQMELAEARQIIKVLHESGAVVSDLEGHYSLITPEGLDLLQQTMCCHVERLPKTAR